MLRLQFLCAMYLDTNLYGTVCGIVVGVLLRIGGGEHLLGIPAPLKYLGGRNFPLKTFAMAMTFTTTVVVSYAVRWLFENGYIASHRDFLKVNRDKDTSVKSTPTLSSK